MRLSLINMIQPDHLQLPKFQLQGACAGIYFLYHDDELAYIGRGWNCLLRVAEHARKASTKIFTHWSFMPIENSFEINSTERQLINKYSPKFNKTYIKLIKLP